MLVRLTSVVNFTNLLVQSANAPVSTVQFHQQNYAQLENTLNFYNVRPMTCSSKIGVGEMLVKSTDGFNFTNVLHAAFKPVGLHQ